MRTITLAVLGIVVVTLGLAAFAGLTPAYMASAPGVATGMGAKLLCSSRYVTGFPEAQSLDDLTQYSPILRYLSVTYDDAEETVTTSLFGLRSASASHVEGVGCAIDHPGFDERHALEARDLPARTDRWPQGHGVETLDEEMQALVEELVAQDNREGLNTRALLVVHRGEIIAEAYAQGAGPDTPLLGWSMAKSLTAIMLGNLELRGLLDLDERPGFEAWADSERQQIRIRDLLTMTDGLAFSERYDPGDDATAMLFTEPAAAAYALEKRPIHPPGAHFNYSSGTANILARLYFDRTGGSLQSSYDDFISNIARPLGLQHSVLEVDASGVFIGSSYFYASARDWARIGQMMLDGGVINGRRIVSEDWVRRSITPNDSDTGRAYGYQWWLNRGGAGLRWPALPEDAFAAQGNREQRLMVIPSREVVIVRLGWTSGAYPVNERFAAMLVALTG